MSTREDDGYILQMFQEGDLVFADSEHTPTDTNPARVIRAWQEGKLVGGNGCAVAFAVCPKCKWKGHTYFVIGDEERDLTYSQLEHKHSFLKRCHAELEFEEKSR